MKAPLVTVAIPYAGGSIDYFHRAWNSLCGQTFTGWQAFVLDDTPGSSAEIRALLQAWSDRRLAYRTNDGQHGIGRGWNACIAGVTTELFCLLHQDDEMMPAYLQTMVELAASFPQAAAYFCGANVIDGRGDPIFSLVDRVKDLIHPLAEPAVLNGSRAITSLMLGNYIMCPTMMFRRSAIGDRRFSPDHRFVLDLRFTLDLLFEGATIIGTRQKLFRYRRHAAQATSGLTKDGPRFQEEYDLFQEVAAKSARRGWRAAAVSARIRPTFRAHAAMRGRWGYVWG